jgi:hypothetical protein
MKKISIKFPDGSSVAWVDRETLKYSDGSHSVLVWVDFEPGFFSKGRIIKASSIQEWESAGDGVKITEDKKTEIINKVTKYYEQNKIQYRIEQ